jgi:2-dehydro-3-deoxy-D-arabinonate dehydratase
MSPDASRSAVRLTRHLEPVGPRWAADDRLLPASTTLEQLLQVPRARLADLLRSLPRANAPTGPLMAPIEDRHEVWAAGVTYLRSREAREVESSVSDVYAKVYVADRPELFFKSAGWRVAGHGVPIRIRADSAWNVPEPELTLVINSRHEIVGYCAGNDVSSRDIEGANPLYLPQAKVYDGSCALGPAIVLDEEGALADVAIRADVFRGGCAAFAGEARTSQMKRAFADLAACLCQELAFPGGVFLMTGTGVVPPTDFSLAPGDIVRITVGPLILENVVDTRPRPFHP